MARPLSIQPSSWELRHTSVPSLTDVTTNITSPGTFRDAVTDVTTNITSPWTFRDAVTDVVTNITSPWTFRDAVTDIITNITSPWTFRDTVLTLPEGCRVLSPEAGDFIPWDNPDNVISQKVEKTVDAVVSVVCLPILFLISAPSNILNMLVFWKHGLKERINLCLFYLSLVDLLHMLNNLFSNVDRLPLPFNQVAEPGPVLKFIVRNHIVGLRGFTWLSGFVSMVIACERCLCVVSPLRSHTILKTHTTAGLLAVGTVLIMTGSMVIGLRWSVACVYDPGTNTTSTALYTSQFYAQNKARMNIFSLFIGTAQPLTYVIVVLATTIVTSVKLKRMTVWREEASSSTLSSREVALTRTLIAVSILYVVCSIPIMMIGAGVMFVPDISLSGRYYNLSNLLVSLFKLASFINATFNFFVYCFLGSKFKATLRSLFHFCGRLDPMTATDPMSWSKSGKK